MQAAILAGGKGTRLGPLAAQVPKPMVQIGGKPLLEHHVELLKRYGITDITFLTSHLSQIIKNYFGTGASWGVSISYFVEESPLGTTGGVKEIEDRLTGDFLLFYGDVMLDVDLGAIVDFHNKREASATLALHPNDHPYDSDLVETGEEDRIVAFHTKPHDQTRYYHNLVNAGLYVLSPRILHHIPRGECRDFGRDVFPAIVDKERLFGYLTAEYLKDIGTPERLGEAREDFESGKVRRLNRVNRRKAVFLDRDGVINREVDLLHHPEDFELLPRVAEAISLINQSEYLAIVVTNQPVVARGMCTIEEISEIHKKLETELARHHAKLDAIYFCPHHPDSGYPGENPIFKIDCDCRKPKTGMIERAAERFGIDIAQSIIIGNSWRDIACGRNAGLKTCGVPTEYGFSNGDCEPDSIFEDLFDAVRNLIPQT